MKDITWIEGNRIQIDPPKRTKKITGTRFATILGLNPWSTPFEMWCAITKTYETPFEDTIYTIAGKTIEPRQAEYMRTSYGMDLITPSERFGEDYFNKTFGDFFPENKHLGGMWDYLGVDEDGNVDSVLEMKTTKRIEDWEHDIPEYYALQAALYAYLLGVDDVIMVASFLEENDYENPENYKPNISNTVTKEFKVSERYPDFTEKIAQIEWWWAEHIDTGISPEYDEKRDAEILKVLKTHSLSPDTEINTFVEEAEKLKHELDEVSKSVDDKEKRLKELNELIKKNAISQFRAGDKKVEIKGASFTWTVSVSETTSFNKSLMVADGVLEKYQTKNDTYKLTIKHTK